MVDVGLSDEAVDMDPDVVDDDVEDDPDSVEADADLTVPDDDVDEDEEDVVVRDELVSPDTRPLVILVRDWGVSSTAETLTDVWVELDDALPSAPDEEDPPVPLEVTTADEVTAADSDALVRDELEIEALAL